MRVAVLCGGQSSEHEVSLDSGRAVIAGLEELGHEPLPVTIGHDGVWRLADPRTATAGEGEELLVAPGGDGAALRRAGATALAVDAVFPVLHGPFGEDGTVQGLLECTGIPYVGSGVLASALCMDKAAFKAAVADAGVPQIPYEVVLDREWAQDRELVLERLAPLGLPVFVKPARLGSSVGISRADDGAGLERSLAEAFLHDPKALVEALAAGCEVECAVMGNEDPVTSFPGQIVIHADWYDYEAKYTEGGMDLLVPAPVPDAVAGRVRELAAAAFRLGGCSGYARVDFFVLDGADEVLLNEINTSPGFTSTSVFARLFAGSGVEFGEVLERLLALALERHAAERAYRH